VQAFSYLQRNITDKNYIKLIFLGVFCALYLAISAINPYLPPFFGVLLVIVYFVRQKEIIWFSLFYLLIFEADRGYYLFSSWVFLFFYIYYLIPLIENFLVCKRCVAGIAAFLAYPLYYLFLVSIDAFFAKESLSISFTSVLIYMFFETLLAVGLE